MDDFSFDVEMEGANLDIFLKRIHWNDLILKRMQCTHVKGIEYYYMNWAIGLISSLPMVQETGVQSQVKSYQRLKKWYLMLL